jgi:hypothetical protein
MPEAYKRCLEKVARKGVKSPHAICTANNAGNVKEYRLAKKAKGKSLGR